MRGGLRAWAGGAAGAAAVVGLGVYFAAAGLNKASALAGVASAFIGLAGLVVSVYGVRQAHRDASSQAAGDGQSITRSRAAGWISQVHRVRGSVRIGNVPPAAAMPPPRAAGVSSPLPKPASDASEPAGDTPGPGGGQSVADSEAGGGITQIDGVDSDVDVGW